MVGTVSLGPSSHSVYFASDTAGIFSTVNTLTMSVQVPYLTTWTLPAGVTASSPTGDASSGYTYTFTIGAPIVTTTVPVNTPMGTSQPNGVDIPELNGVFQSPGDGDPTPTSPYTVEVDYSYNTTYDYTSAEGGPYTPSKVTGPHSVELELDVDITTN